jgi:hypothetical protein
MKESKQMAIRSQEPTTAGDELIRELREWLEENWDPDITVGEWWERLGLARWASPTLPENAYGRGLSRPEATRVLTEIGQFGALGPPAGLGLLLAAPTIATHGTQEQIDTYVRDIVTGQKSWCQLFSEPGAGSDLAGLSTKAVEQDGDFTVNGQKVWTSGGQTADLGMLLARTDPTVPKHQGITYFALDMNQPGVDVRPLREMSGHALFSEVFFSDARTTADAIIGERNNGWAVANTTLAFERAGLDEEFHQVQATGGGRVVKRCAPVAAFDTESQGEKMRNRLPPCRGRRHQREVGVLCPGVFESGRINVLAAQQCGEHWIFGSLRAVEIAQHTDLGAVVNGLVEDVQDELDTRSVGEVPADRSDLLEKLGLVGRRDVPLPAREGLLEQLASPLRVGRCTVGEEVLRFGLEAQPCRAALFGEQIADMGVSPGDRRERRYFVEDQPPAQMKFPVLVRVKRPAIRHRLPEILLVSQILDPVGEAGVELVRQIQELLLERIHSCDLPVEFSEDTRVLLAWRPDRRRARTWPNRSRFSSTPFETSVRRTTAR